MREQSVGYQKWARDVSRAKSMEKEYGVYWKWPGDERLIWRVAWIEDTWELCAVNLLDLYHYVLIMEDLSPEGLSVIMDGWQEMGGDLGQVFDAADDFMLHILP